MQLETQVGEGKSWTGPPLEIRPLFALIYLPYFTKISIFLPGYLELACSLTFHVVSW